MAVGVLPSVTGNVAKIHVPERLLSLHKDIVAFFRPLP
jgi:hypothetical protein